MSLTGATSCPGINELPKSSSGCQRSFTLHNPNSTSLPNLWTSKEPPGLDEPTSTFVQHHQSRKNGYKYTKVENIYNKSVRMYAETDLDEPTDYGSRYDEGHYCDTDSDDDSSVAHVGPVSDTVKTYCTEDTPYETPFNFSTSTSMSDLRQIDEKTARLSLDIDENSKLIVVIEKRRAVRRGGGAVVIVELEDDDIGDDLETADGRIIIEESLPQIGSENIGNISVKSSSSSSNNRSHNGSKPIPIPIAGKSTSNNNSDGNNRCLTMTKTPPKPEYSSNSGLMSPEKPVEYCEEGTPAYPLSRVDSYGALNVIGTVHDPDAVAADHVESEVDVKDEGEGLEIEGQRVKLEVEVEDEKKGDVENTVATEKHCSDDDGKQQATTTEVTKVVKFEEVVNYAEETPLMFSRSSSLTSLESLEGVQQFCDDRSSLISDLSRMTSGLISPSELPDSPTQTVPPSPRSRKRRLLFPNDNTTNVLKLPSSRPLLGAATDDGGVIIESTASTTKKLARPPTSVVTSGVFEDNVTKFKVEHTPIEFSRATSLSDLTVDDREEQQQQPRCIASGSKVMVLDDARSQIQDHNEPAVVADSSTRNQENSMVKCKETEEEAGEKQHEDKKENINPEDVDEDNESFLFEDDEDDEDENLLAACINSGIQSFRNGESKQGSTAVTATNACGPATVLSSSDPIASLNSISYNQSSVASAEPSLIGPSSPHRLLLSRHNSSQNVYEQKPQSFINCYGSRITDKESSVAVAPDDNSVTANAVASFPIPVVQGQQLPVAMKTEAAAGGGDCLKTYCTEDTPAILSHAGSHSDLSLLSVSVQATQPVSRQEPDDSNSIGRHYETVTEGEEQAHAEHPEQSNSGSRRSSVASVSSISSFGSDDSYEDARALLQQCIRAGMSKDTSMVSSSPSPVKSRSGSRHNRKPSKSERDDTSTKVRARRQLCEDMLGVGDDNGNVEDSCDRMMEPHRLTHADLKLLQQCILEGMCKSAAAAANANFVAARSAADSRFAEDNSSLYSESAADLTEADQALLRQCIEQGMPHKSHNASGCGNKRRSRSTAHTRSTNEDMDDYDKMLLRQCILQGMPRKPPSGKQQQQQQQHETMYSNSTVYLRPTSPAAVAASAPFSAGNVAGSSSRKPSRNRDRTKVDSSSRGQQLLLEPPPRPGHACCIHCPRMQQQLKQQSPTKPQSPSSSHPQRMRRKTKTAATTTAASGGNNRSGQLLPPPLMRDGSGKVSGEINLYYVASQILSMKKEFFDRSHVWV